MEASVFDKDELVERLGGNAKMAPRFVALFVKNATGYLDVLRGAVEKGESELVRLNAHAIKGAAANLSAHRVEEVAAALEMTARAGARDEWRVLLERLELEFSIFRELAEQL